MIRKPLRHIYYFLAIPWIHIISLSYLGGCIDRKPHVNYIIFYQSLRFISSLCLSRRLCRIRMPTLHIYYLYQSLGFISSLCLSRRLCRIRMPTLHIYITLSIPWIHIISSSIKEVLLIRKPPRHIYYLLSIPWIYLHFVYQGGCVEQEASMSYVSFIFYPSLGFISYLRLSRRLCRAGSLHVVAGCPFP